MKFWKRQNFSDNKQIGSYQGIRGRNRALTARDRTEHFGVIGMVYILIVYIFQGSLNYTCKIGILLCLSYSSIKLAPTPTPTSTPCQRISALFWTSRVWSICQTSIWSWFVWTRYWRDIQTEVPDLWVISI